MSNSPLVDVTILSPNYSTRADKIRKITLHHMAGKMTAAGCGEWFKTGTKAASSNYGIGYDGKIGLYVPEKYRAWTSSSRANDNQAVTIELSNSSVGGNWPVSDKVISRCIDLVEDICRRNGIAKLNYTGKTDGNLTRHDMFANTNCPGSYLGSKLSYIAAEVNNRLTGETGSSGEVEVKVDTTSVNGVLDFQRWLNSSYYYNIAEDDLYGAETRHAAIKAFQTYLNKKFSTGLDVDGYWGPKTSAAAGNLLVKNGDEGTVVRILQGMLYCRKINCGGFDGDFGSKTEAAVKTYQGSENISVDGIAGRITFSRLFSS